MAKKKQRGMSRWRARRIARRCLVEVLQKQVGLAQASFESLRKAMERDGAHADAFAVELIEKRWELASRTASSLAKLR